MRPFHFYRYRLGMVGLGLLLLLLVGSVIYITGRLVYTTGFDSRALVVGITAPVNKLAPAGVSSHEESLISSMMYEGLLQYDERESRLKPLLASDWKYEDDGQKMVFKLGRATFHNGKRICAADVKYCWEKTLQKCQVQSDVSLFLPVKGSSEFLQGQSSEIIGLKVISDQTLEIELHGPHAAFAYTLTNPIFWVYDSQDEAVLPAGSGPFILQPDTGGPLILLQNENYHRGPVPLKAIEVRIFKDCSQALTEFKGGQLDYLDKVSPQDLAVIRQDETFKKTLQEKPLYTLYGLGFNLNKAPFKDNYLLRRALNYAVDRQSINTDVLAGAYVPLKGVLPEHMPGHNKDVPGYGYDPARARQLLEEAGYPAGSGLPPLTLTYNQGAGHQRVAEILQSQLAQVGILVQLEPLDWNHYKQQVQAKQLAFFRLEWSADYPDADSFLYCLFHSSQAGISNYFAYNNNQVDLVLSASRAAIKDTPGRIKLLQKAEQMIIDDAPAVWLFQTCTAKMVREQVYGLNIDSMDYIDWYKVKLKKALSDDIRGTPGNGQV